MADIYEWLSKGTPVDRGGNATRVCKECQTDTQQDLYISMAGAYGGVAIPFGRKSTKGKVGRKANWALCVQCGDLIPRDQEAVEFLDKQGIISYPGLGVRAVKDRLQDAIQAGVSKSTEWFTARVQELRLDPSTLTKADVERLEAEEGLGTRHGEILAEEMRVEFARLLGINESQATLLLGRINGVDMPAGMKHEPVP